MHRPAVALVVFATVFGMLVLLLLMAVPSDNTGFAWWVWMTCSIFCLTATAMELSLLLVWIALKLTGRLHQDPYVPLRLTPHQRTELERRAPLVAMLMPAHREVSTPDDARAFVDRVVDMLLKTPSYAHLFLLFDSPHSEHDNETAAVREIQRRLVAAGRGTEFTRVFMETYRDKPRSMKNKPGSIHLWQERYSDRYPYMFVLDADSSFLPEDPGRPETCDALARLVWTLEDHPELAMVQSAIHVNTEPTLWGWFQQAGVGMASRYHGLVFRWILEGTVPSYGHNLLYRTADFTHHVSNTLSYLSHDFLDAADIETRGRKCIQTYNVLTCEEGEASLLGFLLRDLRWSRGNAQWANYLLTKRGLPLGSRMFLSIGILCYVWPLIASVLLVASIFLTQSGCELLASDAGSASSGLLGLVAVSLFVPKLLGSASPRIFYGAVIGGGLMAPSVMLIQGFLFLIGAFGTKWTIRGSRSTRMDLDHLVKITRLFAPASMVGAALWMTLGTVVHGGIGEALLRIHVVLLISSPLLATVFSCPLPTARHLSCEPC